MIASKTFTSMQEARAFYESHDNATALTNVKGVISVHFEVQANELVNLQQALEAAPKMKNGFVNWTRNQNMQRAAVAQMVAGGMCEREASRKAWNVGRHFDTNYRTCADR